MGSITIVGTGWTRGQLTLDAVEALKKAGQILLHTRRCGCADWLEEQGLAFSSLDELYDACEDFDEHIQRAVETVLEAARNADVVYGVMDIRDRTVPALLSRLDAPPRVVPGPPTEGPLLGMIQGQTRSVEASDWEDFTLTPRESCMIREVDTRELAAEVKLKLMEVYPEETEVCLLTGDGALRKMPLFEVDRAEGYDHRACILVPACRDFLKLERYDFEHLNEIMRRLCAPDGCPWDRAQTHESLRTCILEEAYEVIDAIDAGDTDHLYDELGDMLLQVAIHAELARLHGEFDITDVTSAICEKMIHRHTHVFGRDSASDADEVLDLWSRNKMAERGQSTHTQVLQSVMRTLPALLRGVKVLKRCAEAGLSAEDTAACAEACADKLRSLEEKGDAEALIGEALLWLCDIARREKVDPELALNGVIQRFIARFAEIEAQICSSGAKMEDLAPESLRKYWDLVKL